MKRNIIYTIWAVAAAMSAASCSQEDFSTDRTGNALPFAITVTDGGFASDEPTRAAENGYATELIAVGECGLYIVRGGAVVHDNVKLTAIGHGDGSFTWQPAETLGGGIDGETYFLYYPYQKDMTGKTDISATSDDATFFAPLISGWEVQADQHDYSKGYSASDLMTATGTAVRTGSTVRLSFEMTHRMALAVIELPKTVYDFTNEGIADYAVQTVTDFTDSPAKPYHMADDTYRYIVNPTAIAPKITGSYAGGTREFSFTPSADAGSYKTYKIDGGNAAAPATIPYTLQTGDYLLADGNLLPKDTDLSAADRVIGIVFHVGRNTEDKSDYTTSLDGGPSAIPDGNIHGYAVALKNEPLIHINNMWGKSGEELGLYPENPTGNPDMDNYHNPDIDWSGYSYTQKIITAAGGISNLNGETEAGYPATWSAVVSYNHYYDTPTNSSGWFLPSIGQLWEIYQTQGELNFTEAGGDNMRTDEYWSSSESYENPSKEVLSLNYRNDSDVLPTSKNATIRNYHVRPILTF